MREPIAEGVDYVETGRWAIIEFPAEPYRDLIGFMGRMGWRRTGRTNSWYATAGGSADQQAREFAAIFEEARGR